MKIKVNTQGMKKMVNTMDVVLKFMLTAINMKANFTKAKNMEKEP